MSGPKISDIDGTDTDWNVFRGCSPVSAGCENCSSVASGTRFLKPGQAYHLLITPADKARDVGPQWSGAVRVVPDVVPAPIIWSEARRVRVNVMSDTFHEMVSDDDLDTIFAIMALRSQHTFVMQTKRSDRMRDYCNALVGRAAKVAERLVTSEYLAMFDRGTEETRIAQAAVIAALKNGLPPNIHLGVSVEDQATADVRIKDLTQTRAAVRWISAEPLLGSVDLTHLVEPGTVDWIVAGGEFGSLSRPTHPNWFRQIRDQAVARGIHFIFRQWGDWAPVSEVKNGAVISQAAVSLTPTARKSESAQLEVRCPVSGSVYVMARAGLKNAGRMLDAKHWNEAPLPILAGMEELA